ncbi:hypothetical protein MGYG_06832 [Nannizzia gypsea CBS 118893]|uniref:Uncharacterized protein n=1 Tax=Arthroderma gypseum (strain ATCC MYA-4604 / CBS 118893) TaxID=535722 RepID=E4V1B8_ARTGP|nr:hypothetical protein MGYG_06832 [Nannizzia gypsea CBS 118893]EFR03833.1 hypothetical protein MGYG_06832 [Nannizzia gypsea CBS 118893]
MAERPKEVLRKPLPRQQDLSLAPGMRFYAAITPYAQPPASSNLKNGGPLR